MAALPVSGGPGAALALDADSCKDSSTLCPFQGTQHRRSFFIADLCEAQPLFCLLLLSVSLVNRVHSHVLTR